MSINEFRLSCAESVELSRRWCVGIDGTGGGRSRPRVGRSGTLHAELELRMLRERESGQDERLFTWFGAVVGREGDGPLNRGTMGGGAAGSCDGVDNWAWLRFLAARCS